MADDAGISLTLGMDPGLVATGWGVVEMRGTRLRHVANGTIYPNKTADMGSRLLMLSLELKEVLTRFHPKDAALESSFFHLDATAALKLGKVCGVCLLAAGEFGIPVSEYSPNLVKKSVAGHGHADKQQIRYMVERLLAGEDGSSEHAADALAVAICHIQHRPLTRVKEFAKVAAREQ